MQNENEIPVPDSSGSDGSQTAEKRASSLIEKPLEGLHMAKTIEGLATSHSRALGGEVSSALIAGATSQLAGDYSELKNKHNLLSEKFEAQRDELEKTRTKNAVLSERIRSEAGNKHLRNLAITIGTSLIGTGIYLSRTKLDMYAFGAFSFGALLLLLGWFSGPKEEK